MPTNPLKNFRIEDIIHQQKSSINRELLLFEILSIATLFVLGVMIIFLPNSTSPSLSEPETLDRIAKLSFLEGQASSAQNSSTPKDLRVEDPITLNSQVTTSTNSRAIIELADGSEIRLNANSRLVITQYSNVQIVINHLVGETYHQVSENPQREYVVMIDEISITSLGTSFNINSNSSTGVEIKGLEDQITISHSSKRAGDSILLSAGEKVELIDTKTPLADKQHIQGIELDDEWMNFNRDTNMAKELSLGILQQAAPIRLTINNPPAESTTHNNPVNVRGQTDLQSSIYYQINDADWHEVTTDAGVFNFDADLTNGENKIVIKSYAQSGQKKTVERIIHYDGAPLATSTPPLALTPAPTPPAEKKQTSDWGQVALTLALTQQADRELAFTWEVAGNGRCTQGYKLIWSTSPNPTYPKDQRSLKEIAYLIISNLIQPFNIALGNESHPQNVLGDQVDPSPTEWDYQYISESNVRATTVTLKETLHPSGTWYFRVCRYREGYCDIYSNQVEVTID